MKLRLLGYFPIIFVLTTGLLTLVFFRPLSRWMAANRAAHNGFIIGSISHAEGSTRRIHFSDIEIVPSPTLTPYELHDGDKLQTSISSKADFELKGNDPFELPEGSGILLQLWNPQDEGSAIYIRLLFGRLNHAPPTQPGRIFVIRDGKLYFPGQMPAASPPRIRINRQPRLSEDLPARPEAFPPREGINPESLSDEYLEVMLGMRKAALQKCWLDTPAETSQASVALTFEISRDGKLLNPAVKSSSPAMDKKFADCLVAAVEGLTLRPYSGPHMAPNIALEFQ